MNNLRNKINKITDEINAVYFAGAYSRKFYYHCPINGRKLLLTIDSLGNRKMVLTNSLALALGFETLKDLLEDDPSLERDYELKEGF